MPRGANKVIAHIDELGLYEEAIDDDHEPQQDTSDNTSDEGPSHKMRRIERKYYRQWEHNLKDKMRSYSKGRR